MEKKNEQEIKVELDQSTLDTIDDIEDQWTDYIEKFKCTGRVSKQSLIALRSQLLEFIPDIYRKSKRFNDLVNPTIKIDRTTSISIDPSTTPVGVDNYFFTITAENEELGKAVKLVDAWKQYLYQLRIIYLRYGG